MGVGYPCPPICNNILTQRHLFIAMPKLSPLYQIVTAHTRVGSENELHNKQTNLHNGLHTRLQAVACKLSRAGKYMYKTLAKIRVGGERGIKMVNNKKEKEKSQVEITNMHTMRDLAG